MGLKHAKLSASSSHRWLYCAGSVKAEEGYPNGTSAAAMEGTAAHELGDLCLTGGGFCSNYLGKLLPETQAEVTQEMADNVQTYVDFVKSFGGQQEYEVRLDFSEWVPEGFGTSDAVALVGDHLHVIDLKYGKGVKVDAFENTQALLYALGAYDIYSTLQNIERVSLHIVQPRLDNIDTWTIDTLTLLKWGEWVVQRAQAALSENAPRTPSLHTCQWCAAKAQCPALKSETERVILSGFDDCDELQPPQKLNDSELRAALESKKLILSWLDAVEDLVVSRLSDGEPFAGFKLVEGRSSRNWAKNSETALLEKFGESMTVESFISPAQAEKLLGKAHLAALNEYIVKSNGKPTLALESDKRKAIQASANDFDNIE